MTLAIIQARMGSTRLPGKVMEEVNGLSLVLHTVRRLRKCKLIDVIIIATPWGKENRPLWDKGAIPIGVDDDDVLSRYKVLADLVYADTIVRITGDCPLIDPELVDRTIAALGGHDLATTAFPKRTFAKGADVEVMSRKGIEKVVRLCKDGRREHVTLYMYENPDSFDITSVYDTEDNSSIIICVDYPEDLERVRDILEWNEDASYSEVIRYLKEKDESEVSRISDVDGGASFSN
jgi:spore coat polysaccharide biosynthesis protein SpsF (cytidylyltransferase family)